MFGNLIRSMQNKFRRSVRQTAKRKSRRYRPAVDSLESRETPATAFLLSGLSSATAGVAGNFSVQAVNVNGSVDTTYNGTVHFQSSDANAILPANATLTNGTGTFSVEFRTSGTQTLTARDTVNSSITGSLGSGGSSGVGFTQSPSASGGIVFSSWLDPDGSDSDIYAYDNFTLSSNQAVNGIDWRGGYYYGGIYGRVWDFHVTFFDSILGGSQPLVTNPQLPETYLANYHVGGTAGEAYVGTVGGVAMYDYHYNLPTNFQAAAGHTYWVRIEASQIGYPDWGVAVGTGGNSQHFQFSTGAAQFSYGSGDEAFTLRTAPTPGVVVSPAATSQFVITGVGATITAGQAANFTVTAKDAFGNTTPAYTGTVHFNSSDWQAVLPADYYFSSGDHGRKSFTATFKTAGPEWVTASDLYNYAIATGQANTNIASAAAAALQFVNFPTNLTAGAPQVFSLNVVDAFGNVATNYTGTVHFTSGDASALLPANYQFTANDAGVHDFSITLNTAGVQTLNAADMLNNVISGSVFTPGQTALFDFDTSTPIVHATMGMPAYQESNGVIAYFTSPNAWLAGGFSVQSHDTTFYNLAQFSGNYLYPNSVYNPNLDLTFSQPIGSLTFTYATADFGQTETPTTVQVTAYQGSTSIGSASSHGAYSQGQTMPQGTLTYNGGDQTFDHVLIEIPWAPAAATDMLIDNITVTTPDVFGVVVNPAVIGPAPSVSSVVVNGGPIVTRDSFGAMPDLLGQNSVVEQLLVNFNEPVTLDPGAFSIINRYQSVSVAAGISPSTLPVDVLATAMPGSGDTQFILTFSGTGAIVHDNSATGTGGIGNISTTIADGFYQLHIDGTRVHANNQTAIDNDTDFWAMYGAGNPSEQIISGDPAFVGSVITVASAGFQDLFDAYGSESDIPGIFQGNPPLYNAWYDANLDGNIDSADFQALFNNYGTEWDF